MKIISPREQVLADRLRELGTLSSGLPPHVVASLRAVVEDEADIIKQQEAEEHADIEARYKAKLRKQVARRVTHKAIGRFFAEVPASSTVEMPATTATTAKEALA